MADRSIQNGVIRHAMADLAADPRQAVDRPGEHWSAWGMVKALAGYVADKLETDVMPTFHALGRQGAKDLHNAIVPAFPDSVRSVDEPGTPLTPTQFMVNADFREYDAELAAAAARGRPEQERGLER